MNNLFNNYDSENDERLDKKFSYNYQVIKNIYPFKSQIIGHITIKIKQI